MAFRKRPRSPEQTWDPNDPLELEFTAAVSATEQSDLSKAIPLVITGLSDEEDARRQIALHLDQSVMFCTNCESYWDKSGRDWHWCQYCGCNLREVGTPPTKRKILMR